MVPRTDLAPEIWDEINTIKAKVAEFSPTEQNYHVIYHYVWNHIGINVPIEKTMLRSAMYCKDIFTDAEFKDVMFWVFDREQHNKDNTTGLWGRKMVELYFNAFSHEWNGEKALERLKIMSPKQQVSPVNIKAVVCLFAAMQCMRLDKKLRRKMNRTHLFVSFLFLLGGIALTGISGFITYKLAEAGGVVFLTIIGIIFGLMLIFFTFKQFFQYFYNIWKYTR